MIDEEVFLRPTYQDVVAALVSRYDAQIVPKRGSRLMRAIDRFLRIITFGRMTTFLDDFATTVGRVIYVPNTWKPGPSAAIVLRHEMVHLQQQAQHGPIVFALLYLFWPLPAVFALSRTRFEQEAYEETLLALLQTYGREVLNEEIRESIIGHFTSAEYFWMCPFRRKVEAWYDSAVERAKGVYDVQQLLERAQDRATSSPSV